MKKRLVTALCSTLVVATALPALAITTDFAGFWRVRGVYANYQLADKEVAGQTGTTIDAIRDVQADRLVDQRFRGRLTIGVNDYIKLVYFGEVDFQWGDAPFAGRNDGGALGGDAANVETKNLFAEVKLPKTPLTATIGLQGMSDVNYDFALLADDMAGIKLSAAKLAGFADVSVGWFQLFKGSRTFPGTGGVAASNNNSIGGSKEGDRGWDLYSLQTNFAFSPNLRVGADLFYINGQDLDNPSPVFPWSVSANQNEQLYYLGANATAKMNVGMPMTLSGWVMYNFGEIKNGPTATAARRDLDVSAWAATVKAEVAPAPGATAMVRALYYTPDDDVNDGEWNSFRHALPDSSRVPFLRDGLMLFLPDAMGITYPGFEGFALNQAAYPTNTNQTTGGYGLFGLVAAGSYVPPAMKQTYVRAAVGHFRATEDDRGPVATRREGKTLGTEVAARIGYIFAERFDLSLNGSYAMLGNFFDNTAPSFTQNANGTFTRNARGADPENPFVLYWMANVNF
jgi:hypothetical protein